MPFPDYFISSGWDQGRHDIVVGLIKDHFLEKGCHPDNVDEQIQACFDTSYQYLVNLYAKSPESHEYAKQAVVSMLSENYVAWSLEMIAYAKAFFKNSEGNERFRTNQRDFRARFPPPADSTPPLDGKFAAAVFGRVLGVDGHENKTHNTCNESHQPMETSQSPTDTAAIAKAAPIHPLLVSTGTTPQQPSASPELQQPEYQYHDTHQQQQLAPITQCSAQPESPPSIETSQAPADTVAATVAAPRHPLLAGKSRTTPQPSAKQLSPYASPGLQQRQQTLMAPCSKQSASARPMEISQAPTNPAAVAAAAPSRPLLIPKSKTHQQQPPAHHIAPRASPVLQQSQRHYRETQQRQQKQTLSTPRTTGPESPLPLETGQTPSGTVAVPTAAPWHPLLLGRSMTPQEQPSAEKTATHASPQLQQAQIQHQVPEQHPQMSMTPSPTQVAKPACPLGEVTNRSQPASANPKPSPKPQGPPSSRPRKRAPTPAAAQRDEKRRKTPHPVFTKLAVAASRPDEDEDEDEAENKAREAVLAIPTKFANLVALGRGLGKSWGEMSAWMLSMDRIMNEERAKLLSSPQQEDRGSVGRSRRRAGTL